MSVAATNLRWARALVDALVRGGVRHAVICPGSRSTPLALACAEADVRLWSVIDERSAGFFALGIAKATRAPALVVATSGTAGAHFLPAVIEAWMTNVPMIVVTADRPWELQGFGAAQTIPQANLFGQFARAFVDLGTPEDSPGSIKHLRAIAARVLATTPRGPVHLNAPFREPLVGSEAIPRDSVPSGPRVSAPKWMPDPAELELVAARLREVERGVIVVGPRDPSPGFADAIAALSRATGYPVLADAASNVRFGRAAEQVISHYDALLRSESFRSAHRPELVLRFGGGLTPKSVMEYVAASEAIVFSDEGALHDPAHAASRIVVGDSTEAAKALAAAVQRAPGAWFKSFAQAERTARREISSAVNGFNEPLIAIETAASVPEGGALVLASSMPIRDVDAFASAQPRPFEVYANRGANGIDGTIATALGIAAATGKPTTLLIGDVAFLHDLGSLLTAKRSGVELTIVVVNNDGGGIFSFLPVSSATPDFERLWGTPHGLQFRAAAEQFGAAYERCENAAALSAALQAPRGLRVVECIVRSRGENVSIHRAIFERVARELGAGPWA